jgi:D-alanyl-D-alanine carboxypeptidase (penicillin-binding protein 5/6)
MIPLARRLAAVFLGVASVALPGALVARSAAVAPSPAPHTLGGPLLWRPGVVHGAPAGVKAPPAVAATSYVVADATTGAVLASKVAHQRLPPASTLKALTALTLMPLLNPRQVYTARYDDAAVEGTRVGMVEKGRYTVQQMFEGLFVMSGNDAANGLSNAAGGVPTTVRRMNTLAAQLQAYDTVAVNPSGLDAPGQLSSAYDLALFGRAGLKRADFRRYAGTVRSRFPGAAKKRAFQIWTRNKFLTRYPGAIGIKNGYTSLAHNTLIAAATRGHRTLIVTLMSTKGQAWKEAAALMDWGFASAPRIHPVGRLVGPAGIIGTAAVRSAGHPRGQSGTAESGAAGRPAAQLYVTGGVVGALALAAAGAAARTVRTRRRRARPAKPETY